MLARWKREAVEGLPSLFENDAAKKRKEEKAHEEELQELYAQIGRLSTQNEWLKKIWSLSYPLRNAGRSWTWMHRIYRYLSRRNCCALTGRVCIINLRRYPMMI